jgi:hypothetical protein
MRIIISSLLILLFVQCTSDKFSEKDYYSEATLKIEREKFFEISINQTINQSFHLQLNDSTENKFQSAFWAMELIQYRSDFTDSVITYIWNDLEQRSNSFKRAFLELTYTLYQNEFNQEVQRFAESTDDPKLFAMCINYLRNTDLDLLGMTDSFNKRVIQSSNLPAGKASHPIIQMLEYNLADSKETIPPLVDLLKFNFGSDRTVVFSFQRKNRDFSGLTVIRKPDGKFLRENDGELFYILHLARAVTNLPGYITNGNTPQGIFSIHSIGFSKNIFIGPTPNLQMVLPYEVNPKFYFHDEVSDTVWNKDYYKNLLPDSWKNYFPIYEAYFAGTAGRNEIIAHGTTIDPDFYSGKPYYPFTPSLGCMTSKEIWSPETGKIIASDQIKFMNAFLKTESDKGFLILIEIDNKPEPVSIDEIKSYIIQAEKE